MPNHIINYIRFNCSQSKLTEILEAIQYTNPEEEYRGIGTIDFQKIIPMPESLSIVSGAPTDNAINVYLTSINPAITYMSGDKLEKKEFEELVTGLSRKRFFTKFTGTVPEPQIEHLKDSDELSRTLELGKQAVTNYQTHGATDWYWWCINNWGTKWNSYDGEPHDGTRSEISFFTANSAPHQIVERLSELYPDVGITHAWASEELDHPDNGERSYFDGQLMSSEHIDWIAAAKLWGRDDLSDECDSNFE